MHTSRTRFGKDIACEFLPSARKSRKVIILCQGMPAVPAQKATMEFFSKKGYWVFFPRYRGSWESGGVFLRKSPEKDIRDVITGISRGFQDLGSGKRYAITPQEIILIGSSFGGTAAILASRHSRVTRAIALSPVIDWRIPSKAEPLGWLRKFMKQAFGEGYRFRDRDWEKLARGILFNPAHELQSIEGKKLFILHARDDNIVAWRSVDRFIKQTHANGNIYKRGGHFGLSTLTKPLWYKRIRPFFRYG